MNVIIFDGTTKLIMIRKLTKTARKDLKGICKNCTHIRVSTVDKKDHLLFCKKYDMVKEGTFTFCGGFEYLNN